MDLVVVCLLLVLRVQPSLVVAVVQLLDVVLVVLVPLCGVLVVPHRIVQLPVIYDGVGDQIVVSRVAGESTD